MYFLPNIIWVIKLRKIRWMGHVGEWMFTHEFVGET